MPIFDQGYQHWNGHLSGHAWRWMAIARHGMRTQFKSRYVRLLIIMAWMPAAMLVGVLAVWGMIEQGVSGAETWLPFLTMLAGASDLHGCRQAVWTIAFSYYFQIELYFIMLIVTLAGPNLISRDLRFNALPLYLSRPLTRLDYFLGKLGMIAGSRGYSDRDPGRHCLRDGRLFQSRPERGSRHVAVVPGQHCLRHGNRCIRGHTHAGAFVVVAAVALRWLSLDRLYGLISNSVAGVLLGVHYDVIVRSIV